MAGGSSKSWLISFSGIDGAGKSTQIANLRQLCAQAGVRVELITFWDDVARLKGLREGAGRIVFRGDAGVGSPEKPIARRDKNVRSPLLTLARLGFYLLDALALRSVVRRAVRTPGTVILFDRYLWDELANLDLRRPALRGYARLLARLIPQPDLSFIFDADPAGARARKPEYPLEWLLINRAAYLGLAELLGGMTVLPPAPLAETSARVRELVLELLGSSYQ